MTSTPSQCCYLLFVVFILSVLPVLSRVASHKRAEDTLIQVNVLFRHGERTPRAIYPNDPYQTDDWPEGLDQLTLKGRTHMYRLGRVLRDRYAGLVGREQRHLRLHMESSAAPRCLKSAEAVLAGLLPPKPDLSLHPGLPWQPVPVHHKPPEHDPVLMSSKDCPRFKKELETVINSKEVAEYDARNKKLYDYLTKHTGQQIHNATDVKILYDTLVCEKSHGLALPNWTEPVFPTKLQYVSAKARSLNTYNTLMKRLKGGPFLLRITRRMKEIISNSKSGNMYLYAGHDQTLVDVVRSLGFTELFEVDFGSCLLFELHKSKSEKSHSIAVFYHNMLALLHPKPLSVPGCGKSCSLDKFLELLKPVIPEDWEKECNLENEGDSMQSKDQPQRQPEGKENNHVESNLN